MPLFEPLAQDAAVWRETGYEPENLAHSDWLLMSGKIRRVVKSAFERGFRDSNATGDKYTTNE
jgi:hypothetical protein